MISMFFIHVKSVEHVPKNFENNFQLTWQNFIPKILTYLLKKQYWLLCGYDT